MNNSPFIRRAPLKKNWRFVASPPQRWRVRQVLETWVRKGRATPRWALMRGGACKGTSWALYFVYAPDGELKVHHRYTLQRLRDAGHALLVVYAVPPAVREGAVLQELQRYADVLIWKDLPGFDFSAYRLGLCFLLRRARPEASVVVLNDSIFGPFAPLDAGSLAADCDVVGFTASSAIENHIQSYAFFVPRLGGLRLWRLWDVFNPLLCLDDIRDVVNVQETRFARSASRSHAVGSCWYSPDPAIDPVVHHALDLVDQGFPFLKRSLIGKHGRIYPAEAVTSRLMQFQHPVE